MIGLGRNTWTRGHCALFRALLGAVMLGAGARLLLNSPADLTALSGALASLGAALLLVGRWQRQAAVGLGGIWLALATFLEAGEGAGLLALVFLLFRHAAAPPPAGIAGLGWRPKAATLVLTRAVLLALLIVKAGTGAWLPSSLDLAGAALLILAAAEPGWVPARRAAGAERVFYDGGCGLCHRSVLFLLQEDRAEALRFAPLGGETFRRLVPPELAATLPDSLVVIRDDGAPLARAAAVVHLCGRLGGAWRPLGFLLRLLPRPLADRGYDRVASARSRLFARPRSACPMIPPELRWRFEG